MIEKNLKEEVMKIENKDVRMYYAQEIKKRLFETYGAGSLNIKPKTVYKKTVLKNRQPLSDVDLRFILAALVVFPELADELEEKLLLFDLSKFIYINMLGKLFEALHEPENKNKIVPILQQAGFEKALQDLWEIGMIKSQKTDSYKIRKQIQTLLAGIQIKQLKYDLNEAKLKIAKPDASQGDYEEYLSLQNELNTLIEQTSDL